jgi:hypothetical protein
MKLATIDKYMAVCMCEYSTLFVGFSLLATDREANYSDENNIFVTFGFSKVLPESRTIYAMEAIG